MSLMTSTGRPRRRIVAVLAGAAVLALGLAGTAVAGLTGGTLPASGFTFTSTTINRVDTESRGIELETKGPVDVKTTYSKVAPSGALLGWHYHQGPVIVTVAVGTLTLVNAHCRTWDVTAGHSYIESSRQVLNAYLEPSKNRGVSNVEWFTTRLYPAGATDPVAVPAPCAL